MKKAVKLRSIYFPFYALLALDWKRFLPMIPIHLAVTGLVLLLTLKCSKAEVKNTLKGGLLPAFGAGFLGDACGVFFRFLPLLLELLFGALGMTEIANFFGKYLSDMVIYNIYMGPGVIKLIWTVLSILFAGVCLFGIQYRVLKKAIPEEKLRRRAALVLAISTAPWGFLCPFW